LEFLGLPFSWGLSFSLALRFLPEFTATYRAIEQAQQSRGLDLSGARGLAGIRARMPIFVAMLITTLRGSEKMAIALEARAFGSGDSQRTDLEPLEFRPTDAVVLVVIVLLAAAALFARFSLGWGLHPWDPLV
jgi:energy-coupling factor transport system permease protein